MALSMSIALIDGTPDLKRGQSPASRIVQPYRSVTSVGLTAAAPQAGAPPSDTRDVRTTARAPIRSATTMQPSEIPGAATDFLAAA